MVFYYYIIPSGLNTLWLFWGDMVFYYYIISSGLNEMWLV